MHMLSRPLQLLLSLFTFLIPLFFWTLTPNYYATPKEFLFYLTVIFLLVAFALHTYKHRSLLLPTSPLTLPLILFTLATTLSLLANPEGRPEALAGKGLILLLLPVERLLGMPLRTFGRMCDTLRL